MRTFTKEELSEIIEKHRKWLNEEEGGERADLSSANLFSANLFSANLSSANLSYANLRSADLSSANLSYANLSYANLSSADLSSANLSSANLRYLVGNIKEIKSIQCDLWMVTYTSEIMSIGCQSHKISEWWDFSDDEIARMDSAALAWWKLWKPILKKIIDVSPATPIVLEQTK